LTAGTAINAELTKGLDSKKTKENDPVQARVVQDVVANGKVIVPRNSKLFGHVTEVKAAGKGQPSSMGIAFDKAVLKNGQEVPVHGLIQALAAAARQPVNSGGYDDSGGGTAASGGSMGSPQSGGDNEWSIDGGFARRNGPTGCHHRYRGRQCQWLSHHQPKEQRQARWRHSDRPACNHSVKNYANLAIKHYRIRLLNIIPRRREI
jgi:hypothetical protein